MSLRVRNVTDLISLRRAHDVRHLVVCHRCRKLGDDRMMICTRGVGDIAFHEHGRCFIKAKSIVAFLKLPKRETDKVCIGDIGARAMKRLVEKRAS